jgi:deoxycytidylate deaminase
MDDLPPPMRVAIKQAHRSTARFKVGAAIARGKKVLAAAHNLWKTHPKFGSGFYGNLHAEGHAIYKALRMGHDLSGCTIYVYRKNNNLAKPCKHCQALIEKYGITDVVYSGATDDGSINYKETKNSRIAV